MLYIHGINLRFLKSRSLVLNKDCSLLVIKQWMKYYLSCVTANAIHNHLT